MHTRYRLHLQHLTSNLITVYARYLVTCDNTITGRNITIAYSIPTRANQVGDTHRLVYRASCSYACILLYILTLVITFVKPNLSLLCLLDT